MAAEERAPPPLLDLGGIADSTVIFVSCTHCQHVYIINPTIHVGALRIALQEQTTAVNGGPHYYFTCPRNNNEQVVLPSTSVFQLSMPGLGGLVARYLFSLTQATESNKRVVGPTEEDPENKRQRMQE
jgi:hypothetical protein